MRELREPLGRGATTLLSFLAFALVISVWQLAVTFGRAPTDFVPTPTGVVSAEISMFGAENFAGDIAASSARIAGAFLASALVAVPLALAMSISRALEAVFEPLIDFCRYVPVPALLPLFIIIGGIDERPKFLVLFGGTFFQLVLLLKDDADNVPQPHLDTARTLGASPLALVRDVMLPYLAPQIYDRFRVTLGWCWTYLVIAELVAVDHGVGHVIKEATRFNSVDKLFAASLTLGVIGLSTDFALRRAFAHFFPWAPRARSQQPV